MVTQSRAGLSALLANSGTCPILKDIALGGINYQGESGEPFVK